ncbi:MAG: HEAT repeat domain-containing protein, partial [Myxococcales bacterium]
GDPEVVKEAVALAAWQPEPTSLLRQAARHGRWDVRRAAARALGTRGDRGLLAEVEALLAAETDPLVAGALAEAARALRSRPGA